MSMKRFRHVVVPTVLFIVVLGVIGTVLTRYWVSAPAPQAAVNAKSSAETSLVLVDEQPLMTAQRLASLATTPEEREFAQNAVRLADHEVDLAFAAALRNATRHPPAVPAAARPVLAHVESLQIQVKDEQKDVARLKALLAKASDDKKLDLEERLQLSAATLDVDEQELDAARQELIRLGGDPRNKIQQLLDQHEASSHQIGTPNRAGDASPQGRTLLVQFRAWRHWTSKEVDLTQAREEIKSAQAELAREHHAFQEEASAKGEKPEGNTTGAQLSSTPVLPPSPAATGSGSASTSPVPAGPDRYAFLKRAAEGHKHLAELDKRASDLQQLEAIYGQWETLVGVRKRDHQMALIEGACWIAVLLLLVLLANRMARGLAARFAHQTRGRHTMQLVARVAVQVVGIAMILLVLFGPPSQLATVLALAGAGLTVALKDFIVGFFGWFILMGRNGIHPGDWVEIKGIGGEVVEVGLLHTVILETGDWSDAGHPTGRKVNFVNSFAIEGHYFNFSTTGQWLWDEIEVPIPAGVDPYPIAEAVHKLVVAETQSNARLAEQEWQRAVPGHVGQTFAPVPAIMVRPTTLGVNVIVRYITRAHERHEQRSRLFYKIVELLRSAQVTSAPLGPEPKAIAAGH
jgi:small-conductance mechanosensitive channel